LVESIEEIDINRHTIFNLHALLADNLIANPESIGRVRKIPVGIGKTAYTPLNIPQKIEEYFDLILAKGTAITSPFEQAFFLLVHIPYLQAFEDVNKRVSRLAANIPLIKHNFAPFSFVNVEVRDYIDAILGVYELNDFTLLADVFVKGYQHSVKRYKIIKEGVSEPNPFKVQYRDQLGQCVRDVILNQFKKSQAPTYVAQWVTENIPAADQKQFQNMVEQELLNIHEGNYARYRLRPAEFSKWFKGWKD